MAFKKWKAIQILNGDKSIAYENPHQEEELKSPVLWMSHSLALAKAAETLLLNDPDFDLMEDNSMNGLAHYQYYATALMLVGYNLEVTLKNMIIINNGIDDYISNESKYMTHDIENWLILSLI